MQKQKIINKRPTLNDPYEFATIKRIYFKEETPYLDIEPIERLERMESKQKFNNKSSR